jgi:hypothetical protein
MEEFLASFLGARHRTAEVNNVSTNLIRHENPIECLADSIQGLPPRVRWLHAQEDVIRANALGAPPAYGPRMRAAELFLSFAAALGFARFAACAASFVLLLGIYLRQIPVRRTSRLRASIFVGIRALREVSLLRDFEEERGGPATFLDERGQGDFVSILRIRPAQLYGTWRDIIRDCWQELGGTRRTCGLKQRELQVAFVAAAHNYAYFRAWFSEARRRFRIEEPVVFSAASRVAFAAVSAGMRAEYRLHGFQSQSLIYPEFEGVRCFTLPEARHFCRRLPNCRVTVKHELSVPIATGEVVAVAGCYGQTVGYKDCSAFITWAKKEGIRVIVRPHPLDGSGFYEQWRNDPGVQFSDAAVPFDEFLERTRPRMVLSWYSTALFDALRRGVVPVTVETEEWRSLDMVFPFREISLHWPQERGLVRKLMACEAERSDFLAGKRKLAGVTEAQ